MNDVKPTSSRFGLRPGRLVKLVFRASDHRLLGADILGEEASELIHIAHAMLHAGAMAREFIDATFDFPTRADAYEYAANDALTRLEGRDAARLVRAA
jgi:NAD(P) transhydrogenase